MILKRHNRRRSKQIVKPGLRTIVETPVATMADTRTMSELLQAPTESYGDAIVIPAILVENFELKVGLLTLVTLSHFYVFERDDPHSHIRWFNKITSTLKYKNVPHEAIKLMLFLFSLEGVARIWLEKEPPRSIHTWEDLVSNRVLMKRLVRHGTVLKISSVNALTTIFGIASNRHILQCVDAIRSRAAAGGNLLNHTLRDALTIIENKSKVRTSRNKPVVSKMSTTTSSSTPAYLPEIIALTDGVKAMLLQNKTPSPALVKAMEETCVTCGGSRPYYECLATDGNTFNASVATGTYNQGGSLPSNTIPNPRGEIKAITTRSGIILNGPSVPPPPLFASSKEVEQDPKTIIEQVPTESTIRVLPPVVQSPPASVSFEIPHPPTHSSIELPKRNPHQPPIPYPSRLNKEKLQDKSDIQVHKFLQMFKKLHFNISLAEALPLIPEYHKMLKDLISNKEKLLGLANTSLTGKCSAVLLKKLPKKLGDTRRFLIPCDFHGLESWMSLADLGPSINLMPLSVWKKLSFPDLTPTRMTLELATRSISYLAGIAEDIFVQVGKFTFPANFVVIDYDVDPRIPLILGRPFLRTACALVDVYGEELILRDGNEDDNFDPKADLRKNKYLLNQYPSIESDIDIIDPVLGRFINNPTVDYSPPLGDDDGDLLTLSLIMMNGKSFCMVIVTRTLTVKKIKTGTLK
nr:reverse transcriptase domain-containing protein [Tanacetum cinerariifolium]